ncbi:hypothetical protein BCR42DRAFT_399901 [Absidia repens]|uniref:Poly(A) RNA polymerase mitochondrial-like central palm domain-containing protein n=1 Tax=Absidia repens TaxID=90262 RepID=A0A1X2J0E9_9FUNG|nr:hypothetical protein BCR42DRAFT_399901 [Absidia repens]
MKEAPWSNKKTLNTPSKEERLSLEILEFEKYISPTPRELDSRKDTQREMERFVERELGLKAVAFGSHCTELCLPGSDIDVDIRSPSEGQEISKQTLHQLRRCLTRSRKCGYHEITFVPRAKVPVLTIDSPRYFMSIDFTLNNPSPSSDRTILWIQQYPELRPMYLVLKHALLALQHPRPNFTPMSSKNNGMASYTLVCLIVNFLEVEAKRHGCDKSSATYYSDLLIEFLGFYSTFDFQRKGIRFYDTNPYFSKGGTNSIMIQDPDVPDSNVGRSTSMIAELQECFAFLQTSIIERKVDGPQNSILERIIPVDQQYPLTGGQRLEGRDYHIQPLYMVHSDSWVTTLREKAIRRADRRDKRDQRRQARQPDQPLDDIDDVDDGGDLGYGNKKWSGKKRRWQDDDFTTTATTTSSHRANGSKNSNKKHRPSSSTKRDTSH